MKYYATKGQLDQAEYAKSIGGRILSHFEEYFNISYPLPKAGLSGVKKNTCGSGSRPTLFFSADPIIFSTRLTVRPYFLQMVAGCSYSVPKWRLLSH
jgi:aminopeptidase N